MSLNPTPQLAPAPKESGFEAEALIRQIVEALPTAAFWKDTDHRIAGGNRAMAELLEFDSADDLVGLRESDFALPSDAFKLRAMEDSILTSPGSVAEAEATFRARSGRAFAMTTRRNALLDPFGRVIGILGTFAPIADRELRQQRLLERQASERMRALEEDLENAKQLQRYLLDQPPIDCPFLDVVNQYRFADKVGGDFSSFRSIGSDTYCFLLADLTGHGISAALFTALLKYIAKEAPDTIRLHPEIFLHYLDTRFYDQIPNGFFTALAGAITRNPATGAVTLSYANAAHPAAIVVDAEGNARSLETEFGAIGLCDDFARQAFATELRTGDRLYLFTDGFEECANANGHEFGRDRLVEILASSHHFTLQESVNRLFLLSDGFRGPFCSCDDRSVIAIEVK